MTPCLQRIPVEFIDIHLRTSQVEGKVAGETQRRGDEKRGRILIEEVDKVEVLLRPFYEHRLFVLVGEVVGRGTCFFFETIKRRQT